MRPAAGSAIALSGVAIRDFILPIGTACVVYGAIRSDSELAIERGVSTPARAYLSLLRAGENRRRRIPDDATIPPAPSPRRT